MKRLWIRGHVLRHLGELAHYRDTTVRVPPQHASNGQKIGLGSMLVVEVPDDLVSAIENDPYLFIRSKFLAEGEDPPYIGDDPTPHRHTNQTATISQ